MALFGEYGKTAGKRGNHRWNYQVQRTNDIATSRTGISHYMFKHIQNGEIEEEISSRVKETAAQRLGNTTQLSPVQHHQSRDQHGPDSGRPTQRHSTAAR